ncbi:MAG: phosphotriesterase family protein [Candidatus Limnocylindria bacterium]
MSNGIVTTGGVISTDELGLCYPHEHLLCAPPDELPDSDLHLDSEEASLQELSFFQAAGGRSIVEMTPRGYGRDPDGLRRLGEKSGVQIICATGWHKEAYSRPWVEGRSVANIAAEMVRDLSHGVGDPPVRAGVIKVGTSLDAITPLERTVIKAAARASLETGAPISTHTDGGTMARAQAELLLAEGVDPGRISIGHADRRLDWDEHRAIMDLGVALIYDQLGKEKYAPDATRIEFIMRLVDAGFGDRLLLSGDLARKSYLPSYGTGGGPGLTFILWRFLPWLRSEGLNEQAITTLTVRNPAQRLTWQS